MLLIKAECLSTFAGEIHVRVHLHCVHLLLRRQGSPRCCTGRRTTLNLTFADPLYGVVERAGLESTEGLLSGTDVAYCARRTVLDSGSSTPWPGRKSVG